MKGVNMEERIEIKLSYESLIALLQGKEFHLYSNDKHIIFHPPFNGVFLTHEQIREIKYDSEFRVFSMIEQLSKHTEKRDSQPENKKTRKETACQKNK